MSKIIVLVTFGKHSSVDYAKVVLFDDRVDAVEYIAAITDTIGKYWVQGEIVDDREKVELCSPE